MNGYCVFYKNGSSSLNRLEAWFLHEEDARDWVSTNSLSHSDSTNVRIEESNYEIKPNYYLMLREV